MLIRRWGMVVAGLASLPWSAATEPGENPLSHIQRVYVEPFPMKAGAGELRDALIAEIKKSSLAVVAGEADADAIITGDGETWIRGYRNLNPRSTRVPVSADALFGGFLSIEVKDKHGDTLWSYLVTLGPEPEGIAKDLAKQMVKHLKDALK